MKNRTAQKLAYTVFASLSMFKSVQPVVEKQGTIKLNFDRRRPVHPSMIVTPNFVGGRA